MVVPPQYLYLPFSFLLWSFSLVKGSVFFDHCFSVFMCWFLIWWVPPCKLTQKYLYTQFFLAYPKNVYLLDNRVSFRKKENVQQNLHHVPHLQCSASRFLNEKCWKYLLVAEKLFRSDNLMDFLSFWFSSSS